RGWRAGGHAPSPVPGHHGTLVRADGGPPLEEQLLRGDHPGLEHYAAALKSRAHGRGLRALRRLLELKRTYPSGPFLAAVDQALHFGLFDLQRLETLILKHVAGDFFNLDGTTDDDNVVTSCKRSSPRCALTA